MEKFRPSPSNKGLSSNGTQLHDAGKSSYKSGKTADYLQKENPLQGIFVDLLTTLEGKACLLDNGEVQHPKPMKGFFELVNMISDVLDDTVEPITTKHHSTRIEETDEEIIEDEDPTPLETLVSVKSPIMARPRNSKQSVHKRKKHLNPSVSTLEDLDTILGINVDSNNNLLKRGSSTAAGETNRPDKSVEQKLLMSYRSPCQVEDAVVMKTHVEESNEHTVLSSPPRISNKEMETGESEESNKAEESSYIPFLRENMVARLVRDLLGDKEKSDLLLHQTQNESVTSCNISSVNLTEPIVSSAEEECFDSLSTCSSKMESLPDPDEKVTHLVHGDSKEVGANSQKYTTEFSEEKEKYQYEKDAETDSTTEEEHDSTTSTTTTDCGDNWCAGGVEQSTLSVIKPSQSPIMDYTALATDDETTDVHRWSSGDEEETNKEKVTVPDQSQGSTVGYLFRVIREAMYDVDR